MHKKCQICQAIRQFMLAAACGAAAGVIAIYMNVSSNMSMLATFGGAVTVLMWFGYRARQLKPDDRSDEQL